MFQELIDSHSDRDIAFIPDDNVRKSRLYFEVLGNVCAKCGHSAKYQEEPERVLLCSCVVRAFRNTMEAAGISVASDAIGYFQGVQIEEV